MAKVRGSKQESMVVKPHRPLRQWFFLSITTLVMISLMSISFLLGRHHEKGRQLLNPEERQQLQLAISKMAAMERDNMVDRLAVDSSRQTIRALEAQVQQLNKSVSFYRSIMEPENGVLGLHIQSLNVERSTRDRYRMKWVLAQLGKQDALIQGDVDIRLRGVGEGEEKVLSLKDLAKQELNTNFRFRYFQNFSAEVRIPDDFVVAKVEVLAQANGKKVQAVSREFDWVVQETFANVGE